MPQAMSIKIDGADHLLFRHMAWSEALGEVPRGTVDLLSLEKSVDPRKLLGKQAKIRLQLPHDRERFFNGYVTRFVRSGSVGRYYEYVAEVRPWTWLLSRTADCRIFQKMKVDAVLRKVFDGHAFADFKLNLTGSYPETDYCVQYRESDLDFVNRLCERFGLYYWFEYTSDGHQKMVIADSLSAHEEMPGYESLPFHPATENPIDSEHVSTWHSDAPLLPGKFVQQDYFFETSSLDLKAESKIDHKHEHAGMEVFDYPGPYVDMDGANADAKLTCEISGCTFATFNASTNAQGIRTGHTFKLTQHPDGEVNNKKFLVTALSISMQWAGYEAHGADEGASFHCQFTSIPANVQFRTQPHTPKPVVLGPQTAVVVGPDGEEIYTDKFGRIKVLFHWDRYGKGKKSKDGQAVASEDRSCWVRVAQLWAGNRYGTVFIPRIGHEVVVDFIDGDPDRPIATGCVYNDKNPPPWLPDSPTQSGVLTRSSKTGSAANANAIRFEDKKGSEQLWIHAEKNQDIEVENDETHSVGHDRTKRVDHDETTTVGNNRTESVGANETISISANRNESVGANESIAIGANRSESVGANEAVAIGANRTLSVARDETHDVGDKRTITVGKDQEHTVGGNDKTDISKNMQLTVGENRTAQIGKDDKTQVSKKFYLEAGDEITLKTGDASIVMKKDGTINIKGKDITVTGSGKIGIKASGDMVLKGSKIAEN
jgi:type VI secretion system secreted protein VgrG